MGSGTSKAKKVEGSEKENGRGKLLIKTLSGHTGGINCMDISSTGGFLLTGSDDRTARVWDLVTYENKVVLEGHTGYISCCRIWQDRFALTGSVDKTVRKWNMLSGNCVLKMELHRGIVNRMLVYGSYLFSSSYDRTVVCWDVESGHAARVFRGHKQSVLPMLYVKTAEHDPKGGDDIDRNKDALITGSMDCTAKIWSINSGTSLRTFRGHKGAILCLTVDTDKKYLFTGSTDYSIRKWNLANGTLLKSFKGHEGSVICLEINHKLLYSGSVDSTARCWVAEFGDTTRKYGGHEHMLSDMKYHNGLLITSSGDSTVRVFDAKSGTQKRIFKGHKYAVNCIMPVDNMVLSASYDGSVKIWNIRDLVREKLALGGDSCSSLASSAPSLVSNRDCHSAMSIREETEIATRRQNGHDTLEMAAGAGQRQFATPSPRTTVRHENESVRPSARPSRQNNRRQGGKAGRNKVVPVGLQGNVNNNNNNVKTADLTCGADDLDDLLNNELSEDNSEGYTSRSSSTITNKETTEVNAETATMASVLNEKNCAKPPRKLKHFAPSNSKASLLSKTASPPGNTRDLTRSKEADIKLQSPSESSGTITSMSLSLPSTSNSSRTSFSGAEVSRKRIRTEESKSAGSRMSSADLALVDEEMRMIAVETDSTSTGYHSDKSVSQSPSVEKPSLANETKRTVPSGRLRNNSNPVTAKQPPRTRTVSKASSRSSLWATCSNSTDASINKGSLRGKKGVGPKRGSNATRDSTLTQNERERLEDEILQMS